MSHNTQSWMVSHHLTLTDWLGPQQAIKDTILNKFDLVRNSGYPCIQNNSILSQPKQLIVIKCVQFSIYHVTTTSCCFICIPLNCHGNIPHISWTHPLKPINYHQIIKFSNINNKLIDLSHPIPIHSFPH